MQTFSINYKNKTLIPPEEIGVFAIKGENKSTRYYFEIDTNLAKCDWDLKKGAWSVKYKNAKGETGEQILTDVLTASNLIRASFLIPGTLTKESGIVSIELCCTLASEDKHWHISPFECKVGPFINVSEITADDPKYDAINQMIGWFQKYPDPTNLNTLIDNVQIASVQLTNCEQTLEDLTDENTKAGSNITNLRSLNSQGTTLNTNLTNSINSANTAKTNLDSATSAANTAKTNLQNAITTANTAKTDLDNSTTSANTSKTNLQNATTAANTVKTNLDASVSTANTVDTKVNQTISEAEAAKEELAVTVGSVPASVTTANNALHAKCTRSGIEIMHIKGKTTQQTTQGYQLFDANRIESGGGNTGVKFFNNGDGTFSVFSSTSTSDFARTYTLNHDAFVSLYKAGNVKLLGVPSESENNGLYGELQIKNATLGNINVRNGNNKPLSQSYIDDDSTIAMNVFFSYGNKQIQSGVFQPMLYQDGDGTWEPFTGGKPGPNSDYPLPLNSFEANKIVVHGKNVAVFQNDKYHTTNIASYEQLPDGTLVMKTTSGASGNAYVGGSVGNGNKFYQEKGTLIPIPDGSTKIYLSFFGADFGCEVHQYDKYKTQIISNSGSIINVADGAKFIAVTPIKVNATGGQTYTAKIMVSFEPITEYVPPHYEEVELTEPLILRSCATGEYDEYLGDGKIVRRCRESEIKNPSFNPLGGIQRVQYLPEDLKRPSTLSKRLDVFCTMGTNKPNYQSATAFYYAQPSGTTELTYHLPENITNGQESRTWFDANKTKLKFIYPLEIPEFEIYPMPILPSWDDTCRAYFVSDTETEITWRPCPLSDPIKKVQETETQVADNTTSIEYLQTQINTLNTTLQSILNGNTTVVTEAE